MPKIKQILAEICKKCSKKLKNEEKFLKTRLKKDKIDVYCEKCFPKN